MSSAVAEVHMADCKPVEPAMLENPLTRIFEIDEQVKLLGDRISALQQERNTVLVFVTQEGIIEDLYCERKTKVSSRTERTLHIDALKAQFPEAFERICEDERAAIEKMKETVGTKVKLGTIDALVTLGTLSKDQLIIDKVITSQTFKSTTNTIVKRGAE